MTTYEVQCRLSNGKWKDITNETFASLEEATDYLRLFMDDCLYSVAMGYRSDFNSEDWRVSEC